MCLSEPLGIWTRLYDVAPTIESNGSACTLFIVKLMEVMNEKGDAVLILQHVELLCIHVRTHDDDTILLKVCEPHEREMRSVILGIDSGEICQLAPLQHIFDHRREIRETDGTPLELLTQDVDVLLACLLLASSPLCLEDGKGWNGGEQSKTEGRAGAATPSRHSRLIDRQNA